MSAQMPPDQWSMNSPAAANRGSPSGGGGWNVSNVLQSYFGKAAVSALEDSGETAFKRQLYQSMIGQLLNLKTEIESWRSQNVWGTTFWMCTSEVASLTQVLPRAKSALRVQLTRFGRREDGAA